MKGLGKSDLIRERKAPGRQASPCERAGPVGKPGRGPATPVPRGRPSPGQAVGAGTGRAGGEKAPSLPLGKYSGHSFSKSKGSVFPLLLIIPTLQKITTFTKQRKKNYFQTKNARGKPSSHTVFCKAPAG